jgi:hypothetical protein
MEIRNSILQIQQKGPEWWTGGSFGPEAGLIGVLGIFVIIVLTLLYLSYSGVELKPTELFKLSYSECKGLDKTNII